jgi:replicative DNA helicase
MNSEYALIQLLLREPHQILHLHRKGFGKKHFKNVEFGKAFKLIYETYSGFASIPTSEQLKKVGIDKNKEEIPFTINYCAEQILEEFNKHKMMNLLVESGKLLISDGAKAAQQSLRDSQNLIDLEKTERSKNTTELNEEFLDSYEKKEKYRGKITGIATGFDILDKATMGLNPQWLVTIAGRNASYKTWVLVSWALNAWRNGNNVAIFSCEMSHLELKTRIHGLATDIQPTKIQKGTLEPWEKDKLIEHLKSTQEPPWGNLIINENPTSMHDVDADVLNINETTPLDIIFIDSAYRMNASGDSDVSRQASIARAAKNLAKKYNIPVAKANATDKTKDKTTSGGYFIHGTDAWNQDSDIVFSLNRPENYAVHNYSDFIMDKFRHGAPDHYILELNLSVPIIAQIDAELARSRIGLPMSLNTQRANASLDFSRESIVNFQNLLRNRSQDVL